MQYITQINLFNQYLETNYISSNAQLLWYKLMNLFNKTGWKVEWLAVDNLRLMSFIQVNNEKSLIKARNELISNNFIDFQKGKKSKPSLYKIIDIQKINESKSEQKMDENISKKTNKEQCFLSDNFNGYTNLENLSESVNDRINDSVYWGENDRHNKTKDKEKDIDNYSILTNTKSVCTDLVEKVNKNKILSDDFLQSIKTSWSSIGIGEIKSFSNNRLKMLNTRLREYGQDSIFTCIQNIKESNFLRGQNGRSWIITFDWLIKPNNYIKVLENQYANKENSYSYNARNNEKKINKSFSASSQGNGSELEELVLSKNDIDDF